MTWPPEQLENSPYGADDKLEVISKTFDETTKKIFRTRDDVCRVQFGSSADRDNEHGIIEGKLKLEGCV